MCGIAGGVSSQWDLPHITQQLNQELRHRGPDDEGIHQAANFVLGHTRLSIIDLESGHQPLFSPDKRLALVCNGEIYNYKEIRKQFASEGYVFQTQSDSEVILALYQKYGKDCVQHLNGMFAFALFDQQEQRILIARDPFGIKPLHYYWDQQNFLFSSELQALSQVPEIQAQLSVNADALWHYFNVLYVPSPLTIFNQLHALDPGHLLDFRNGQLSKERYWSPNANQSHHHSLDAAADELESLIDHSTKLQMQSDVPYGAFLSGGVDSSLIVQSMAKQSDVPIKTFNIQVCDQELDDSVYARQMAAQCQTEHFEQSIQSIDPDLLGTLVSKFGQPFADSSLLPTYLVSQQIRSFVTVALGGDGADELFSGYNKYRKVLTSSSTEKPSFVEQAFFRVPTPLKQQIFSHSFQSQVGDTFDFLSSHCYYSPKDDFDHLRQLDLRFFLEGDIFTKVDVMSMAHSLETRVPFLDKDLVDFSWRLPQSFLATAEQGKVVLKHLLKRTMPVDFVDRPKIGLMLPINHWLDQSVQQLFQEAVHSKSFMQRFQFSSEGLSLVNQAHQTKTNMAASYLIFAFVVFYLWAKPYPNLTLQ